MFNSVNNKLINISNGKPNQRTPLMLLNNELNQKSLEKGKKKAKHEVLWEANKQKILRNSVCF
jgi:hypothetical protein